MTPKAMHLFAQPGPFLSVSLVRKSMKSIRLHRVSCNTTHWMRVKIVAVAVAVLLIYTCMFCDVL